MQGPPLDLEKHPKTRVIFKISLLLLSIAMLKFHAMSPQETNAVWVVAWDAMASGRSSGKAASTFLNK